MKERRQKKLWDMCRRNYLFLPVVSQFPPERRLSVIKSAFRNNLHTTLSSIHGYKALVTYHHHHHPHITIVVEASANALAPSPRENQFHEEFQGYVQLFPLIVTRSTSFMGHSSDTKDDIRKAQ